MNRRQILARLLGGSAAVAAAGIWIPGERSLFLPPRGGWRTREFATLGYSVLNYPEPIWFRYRLDAEYRVLDSSYSTDGLHFVEGLPPSWTSAAFPNWSKFLRITL